MSLWSPEFEWDMKARARRPYSGERFRKRILSLQRDPGMSRAEIAKVLDDDISTITRRMNGAVKIPIRVWIGLEFIKRVGRHDALAIAELPPPTIEDFRRRVLARMQFIDMARVLGVTDFTISSYAAGRVPIPKWMNYFLFMMERKIKRRKINPEEPREGNWITVIEAARRMKVARQTIHNWLKEGRVTTLAVPGRGGTRLLIDADVLVREYGIWASTKDERRKAFLEERARMAKARSRRL